MPRLADIPRVGIILVAVSGICEGNFASLGQARPRRGTQNPAHLWLQKGVICHKNAK